MQCPHEAVVTVATRIKRLRQSSVVAKTLLHIGDKLFRCDACLGPLSDGVSDEFGLYATTSLAKEMFR